MDNTCYNEIGSNLTVLRLSFRPLDLRLPPHGVGLIGSELKYIKITLVPTEHA